MRDSVIHQQARSSAPAIVETNRDDQTHIEPVRRNLRSIHALRGLAAGAVVIAHSLEHGHYGGRIALFTGRFGVEVFFVISGVVIFLAAGSAKFSPLVFLRRRFFRIAPLYWATTVLVAGLAFALPSIFKSTAFEPAYFWKSMFFIPDVVPGRSVDWRPLFKLGWTLNYEVFFYIVVASLFWCRSFNQRAALILAIMAALIALALAIPARTSAFTFYANLNLMPFASGVALAWLIQTKAGLLDKLGKCRRAFFVCGAAATLFSLSFPWERFRMLDGHTSMTIAAITVTLTALSLEMRISEKEGIWKWLGDVSYSLYLLHMFVVGVIWNLLHKMHISDGIYTPLIAILVIVPISCVISTVSYHYFEKPINAFGR